MGDKQLSLNYRTAYLEINITLAAFVRIFGHIILNQIVVFRSNRFCGAKLRKQTNKAKINLIFSI